MVAPISGSNSTITCEAAKGLFAEMAVTQSTWAWANEVSDEFVMTIGEALDVLKETVKNGGLLPNEFEMKFVETLKKNGEWELLEKLTEPQLDENYWEACKELLNKDTCTHKDLRGILEKALEDGCKTPASDVGDTPTSGEKEAAAGTSDGLNNANQCLGNGYGFIDPFDGLEILTSVIAHNCIKKYAERKGVAEHNKTAVYWASLVGSASLVALGRAALGGNRDPWDIFVRFAWNAGANVASDAVLGMGKYVCSCLSSNNK